MSYTGGNETKKLSQESEVQHSVKSVFTSKSLIFMFPLINGRCLFFFFFSLKLKLVEFMGSDRGRSEGTSDSYAAHKSQI